MVVLAGPSLVACLQSPDGTAACLRQKMAEAGFLPAEASPEPVGAPGAAAPAGQVPTVAGVTDGTAITLLRAEPDGSLVIAGSGNPNAQIEAYANGELLGTTKAEQSGDWVVVPETPLPAGGVEITVGEAGSEARAAQSFVVLIDPGRAAEPLVVATTPGEASRILQGLPHPLEEAPPAAAVATPEPVTEPESATEPAAEPEASLAEPASATPAPAAPLPQVEPEQPQAPRASVAMVEPEATAPEPSTEVVPVVTVPPSIDAIEIDGTANFFAGGGSDGATVRLYVDGRHVADARIEAGRWLIEAKNVLTRGLQRVRVDMLKPGSADVAARAEVDFVIELPAVEPETAAPAQVEETQPETVAAEPSDRGLEPAADAAAAPPADRELATAPEAIPAGQQERDLAADAEGAPTPEGERDLTAGAAPAPAGGTDRDLGAAGKPAAEVATAPDLAQPPKEAGHTADSSLEIAGLPGKASTGEGALPQPAAGPASPSQPDSPAPAVPAGEPVAAPVAPVTPVTPTQPLAPATTAAPANPAGPAETQPGTEPATAVAAVPPDAGTAVPTLRAVPVGDPEAMRFASGKAIIRQGDNLWSIAQRVYGDGLKYTTIYRANEEQIRNPSRIYPGQVFDLPAVYGD